MTSDTGLTTRLRQHSRRGGLAIALVMALTAAICIGGFAVIYAQLQPFISDFVSQDPPDDGSISFRVGREETPTPETGEADEADDDDVEAVEDDDADDPPAAEVPAPTEPPPPTAIPDGFQPDFQLIGEGQVNLRGGPGTDFEVIIVLFPLQPLQYLGQEQVTDSPEPESVWRTFRTEDGLEGWVRQIDTEPYDPNA